MSKKKDEGVKSLPEILQRLIEQLDDIGDLLLYLLDEVNMQPKRMVEESVKQANEAAMRVRGVKK